jgi:O-antigen/teichoic acid export membrane protein
MSDVVSSEKNPLQKILKETTRFAVIQSFGAVFTWVASLALSRMLNIRAFGVYAVGTFLLGIGGLLGDGGLGATLLRKRTGVTEDEYRVTVTFLLCVGMAFAIALFVATPWVAVTWHLRPDEAVVLRVMAPLFLVSPLRVTPYIRMERELRFGDIATIELVALFVRHTVALLLAWKWGGPWALAGAQISGAVVQLALAYRASPGFPGLALNIPVLRSLLGYGVRVQALSIAAFFKDNISAAYLGSIIGPDAVGTFDFGLKYAQLPVVAVNALARVQLPAYARFEATDPELFTAVKTVARTALVLGIAMLVTLAAGATAIIPLAYKAQWLVSVPVVWGILGNMAGGLVAGPLFTLLQAQGRAGLALGAFAIWTLSTWALVIAVRHEGIGAVAMAHSVVTIGMTFWLLAWAGRHMKRPLWPFCIGPSIAGLCAVLSGNRAEHFHLVSNGWQQAAITLVTYIFALLVLDGRRTREDIRGLLAAIKKLDIDDDLCAPDAL